MVSNPVAAGLNLPQRFAQIFFLDVLPARKRVAGIPPNVDRKTSATHGLCQRYSGATGRAQNRHESSMANARAGLKPAPTVDWE